MDAVDKISLMPGSATISRCVVPSRGRGSVVDRGIICIAAATAPGSDASVGRRLTRVCKAAAAA
jgi:hypothetical protein